MNKELRNEMKVQKARNIKNREYVYEPDLSEWTTRKRYIDADLEANGYVFDQDKKRNCVEVEYPVVGMPNQTGRGYVDYVIWGDTGKIIAVVEAKRQARAEIKGGIKGNYMQTVSKICREKDRLYFIQMVLKLIFGMMQTVRPDL